MFTSRSCGGRPLTSRPAELDAPAVGALEAGDQPQAGRLARAGRAEHREELVLGDLEVDAVDGHDLAVCLARADEAHGGVPVTGHRRSCTPSERRVRRICAVMAHAGGLVWPRGQRGISRPGMGRLRVGIVLVIALAAASPASAQAPVVPWDGNNPFRCQVQHVGTGDDFPDPGADPFCVEFDKRSQNVTDLGDRGLPRRRSRPAWRRPSRSASTTRPTTGPARSSRASRPSCGTGTAATSSTRRKAVGGVSRPTSASAACTVDPRLLPGFPMQLWPYFGPGHGGVRLVNLGAAEPTCAAKVDTPAEARRSTASRPCTEGMDPLSRREVLQRASALGVAAGALLAPRGRAHPRRRRPRPPRRRTSPTARSRRSPTR